MFRAIEERFKDMPVKSRIAEFFLDSGISIVDGKPKVNGIDVPLVSIARGATTDRKTVYGFLDTVRKNFALNAIFNRLRARPDISQIAPILGYEVLHINSDFSRFQKAVKRITEWKEIAYLYYYDGEGIIVYDGSLDKAQLHKVSRIVPGVKVITPDEGKKGLICKKCDVEYCPRRDLHV